MKKFLRFLVILTIVGICATMMNCATTDPVTDDELIQKVLSSDEYRNLKDSAVSFFNREEIREKETNTLSFYVDGKSDDAVLEDICKKYGVITQYKFRRNPRSAVYDTIQAEYWKYRYALFLEHNAPFVAEREKKAEENRIKQVNEAVILVRKSKDARIAKFQSICDFYQLYRGLSGGSYGTITSDIAVFENNIKRDFASLDPVPEEDKEWLDAFVMEFTQLHLTYVMVSDGTNPVDMVKSMREFASSRLKFLIPARESLKPNERI